MDIKEFVSATLIQIIEGVADAQNEAKKFGAKINPLKVHGVAKIPAIKEVEFDVAVVTESSLSKGTKGGIKVVGIIDFGGGGDLKKQESITSRVKFQIPLSFSNSNS
jgi:hypothetical protein